MRAKLLTVSVMLLAGCATTRFAKLYDLETAAVLVATFLDNGTGRGPISIGRSGPDTACAGEFVTVPRTSTAWGTIFAGGKSAFGVASLSEDSQMGQAVTSCKDGAVIECEYVTSAVTGNGYGACRDNQGHRYRLMF